MVSRPGSYEKSVAALDERATLLLKGNEIGGRRPPLELIRHSFGHRPGGLT